MRPDDLPMNKPLLRLLYFILMGLASWLSLQWLWKRACASAGISRRAFWLYLNKHRPSHVHYSFAKRLPYSYLFMLRSSPEPQRTLRLLRLYQAGAFPRYLCLSLSLLGVFFGASILDGLLYWAGLLFPLYILCCALAGWILRRRPAPPDEPAHWWEHAQFVLRLICTGKPEPEVSSAPIGQKVKSFLWSVCKVALALGALLGLGWLLLSLFYGARA